ncbi:MAG: heavy metal-binding domain-containing protein [Defluviitaleaceae bacterium]|nr:heavy metal-binding domain-containing protein [Defluviitaleaceae bacterium]
MLIVTTESVPGKNLQTLGIVKGSVVQAKHIGRDIMAGLKSIVGGELRGYTDLMDEARRIATERMQDEAKAMNADAIVCFRYNSSAVMDGACEIMAYGTAVKFVS